MEAVGILLVLGLIVCVLVLPFLAMLQAGQAKREVQSLEGRLRELEASVRARDEQLRRRINEPEVRTPEPVAGASDCPDLAAKREIAIEAVPSSAVASPGVPPPLPAVAGPDVILPKDDPVAAEDRLKAARAAGRSAPPPATTAPPAAERKPAFTLEQFMGVKLFAWVGGLALFLGIVFFVKLSIERGWISAELRTIIGFISGTALVVFGAWLNARKAYEVLGQALCATGTVVLYGMTYAAHAYYKFPVLAPPLAAFALMMVITTIAFLLAVRMEAQVVVVLGMIGGFLTPVLCSTGRDEPLALFGYIALLDIGVLAVAKRRRWLYLTALAAAGTVFMQFGWVDSFFMREGYIRGAKTGVVVAVFLSFAMLFTAAAWWTRRKEDEDLHPAGAAYATCASALLMAFAFLAHGTITDRPALLYTFVFAINLISMVVAWKEPRMSLGPVLIGLASFVHLALWTMARLTAEMLPHALVIYLLFGLMHTSYGLLWQHRQAGVMRAGVVWVPVTTLLLMLLPVLRLENVSLMVWPALLIVDLAVITLALLSRALGPVLAALLLTLFTTARWLFKLPANNDESLTLFLCVLGGFAIVFAIASSVLARKVVASGVSQAHLEIARWLPLSSAVLPFWLLIMAILHLRVSDPSPVFGVALLLNIFLLEAGRITRITSMPMAGLLCTLVLELVWHAENFSPRHPWPPLLWYLGFHALFTLHPHVFRRQLLQATTPWAAAALAGAGTFALVYPLVKSAWPNDWMGLVPLAFAAPQLLSLLAVVKVDRADDTSRTSQIAWFGGMSLFFITLVFPIQFERQWITLSWALEGASLCWLFRRVPHPGLRAIGTMLLITAFVRLALNPAVFEYQVRGAIPIWNWQLYAYSVSAVAMFFAAWWMDRTRGEVAGLRLRGLFATLGGILLFLLLNIEIADAFTPAGSRSIVLEFSGNFARDMTYSISWGLFALALMMIGFALRSKYTRVAGIGLLGATLLKLFLHDLSQLDSVYRIGALIVVALTALAASFLYQRFIDRSSESDGKA